MKIEEINNGNLNKVFKLVFNNKSYIVRVSEFDNTFETDILNLLVNNNMNTPKVKANFVFENKFVMICDYIEGINPDICDNSFYKNLSLELKKLHNIKVPLKMENTNFEGLEKLKNYYEVSINSEYLKKDFDIIDDLFKEVSNNLDFDLLPKCIVHSDIKKENIIISDNEVHLIDFGNCYIGNRFIDLIRIFMWFFIKQDCYDTDMMKVIIRNYFDSDNKITNMEKNNLELLLKFCLLYNLLKDIYLFEKDFLSNEYIETSSLKWLEVLKDEIKLAKVLGVLKNA